jgi:hypothetical protein
VTALEGHVKTMRNAVREKKWFPLVATVVEDLNAGTIARPPKLIAADDESDAVRYTITQCITTLGRGAPLCRGGASLPLMSVPWRSAEHASAPH